MLTAALIILAVLLLVLSRKFGPKNFSLNDCLDAIEKEDLQVEHRKDGSIQFGNSYCSIIYTQFFDIRMDQECLNISLARTLGVGRGGCLYIFWEDDRIEEWRHNSRVLGPMNLAQQGMAHQILILVRKAAKV